MTGSIRLFRLAGIEVGIHPSWFIVFGLVAWSLATNYFPVAIRGLGSTEAWALGIVAALLLFASVLIHEIAHSLVARRRGLEASSITLFIFGGVSTLTGEAPRASVEFLVAVVGPITSFLVAAAAYIGATSLGDHAAIGATLDYVATVNALLGVFNLIPGFPLDGGRVLRSVLWQLTGSLRQATRIAVAAGRIVAYAFLIWGFVRVLGGDLLGGIWIAAIGWFMESAATSSLAQLEIERLLSRVFVKDLLTPDPSAVDPETTVRDLIDHYLLPANRRAIPVARDGRILGMVTLGDIREVAAELRASTPVAAVMGGRDGLVVVRPADSLKTALAALGRGDFDQVPVVDDGRLVGVLDRAEVLRQIQLREALDVEARARA
jgi:Zn-dependent protease